MLKKLILSLLSALLLALPWLGFGGWTLLVAFVPLLILQSESPRRFGLWVLLSFTLWIVASTWWVSLATPVAAFAIPIVGLFFSWIPFMIFHYIHRRQSGHLAWVVLVTVWIAFEALYTHQDISFPWLNLGNGFASTPWMVQWYEYTGTFGGTLWVLVSNILAFNLYQERQSVKRIVALSVWIVLPLGFSIGSYMNYEEVKNPINVSIIQPNFDPYSEKFGTISSAEQTSIILELAQKAPRQTDFIITPETSFGNSGVIWLPNLFGNGDVRAINDFLRQSHPRTTFIAGAVTYQPTDGDQTTHYNSALWIDSSSHVDVYHKSKLVVGAELTPYPELFKELKIDLGGISGNFGRQAYRSVFKDVGVAICYESIYGSYFTEYINGGAQAMFIITNDGWWGDTQGHVHHLNYARLRAVENRRSIARSANTGISAVINQRGDIVQSLPWDTPGVINATINRSTTKTVYAMSGDLIARLSLYVLALSLLFFVGQRYRKKH